MVMFMLVDDALRELSSPVKSGSIFYLTQDDKFMIKIMKKSEVKLLGRSSGFQVASTHWSCTKGLWMWSAPLKRIALDGTEYHLLLLDSEGIDAYDQTVNTLTPLPRRSLRKRNLQAT